MNSFDALVLGLVQGLTEFIPVSSSGHLILIDEWLGLNSSFSYDLILNIGTLFAALFYFRGSIKDIIVNFRTTPLAKLLAVGTIPAVIAGVIFKDAISGDTIRSIPVITTMLFFVGLLFLFESRLKIQQRTLSSLKPPHALAIGLAQSLALMPGTSRSGATILTARFVGLSRTEAARFSFLLSIPIIAGAILFTLISEPIEVATIGGLNILIGIATSFLSSLFAIHFMLKFLQKSGLLAFGIYRVVLACVLLFLL